MNNTTFMYTTTTYGSWCFSSTRFRWEWCNGWLSSSSYTWRRRQCLVRTSLDYADWCSECNDECNWWLHVAIDDCRDELVEARSTVSLELWASSNRRHALLDSIAIQNEDPLQFWIALNVGMFPTLRCRLNLRKHKPAKTQARMYDTRYLAWGDSTHGGVTKKRWASRMYIQIKTREKGGRRRDKEILHLRGV